MPAYEFDVPMPDSYAKLLKDMVSLSRKGKCLTGTITGIGNNYNICIGEEGLSGIIPGDPIDAFRVCGFLEWSGNPHGLRNFTLTPKAFGWGEYQKKNRFGKWLARNPYPIRDLFIALSFVISLTLAVIQILQALTIIPTP